MIDLRRMLEQVLRDAGSAFERITFLELNRSSSRELSVALLVFADDARTPFAFVKATSDARLAGRLQSEYRNLHRLAELRAPSFARTIPRPLYFTRFETWTVLVESAVSGLRMKDFPSDRYPASAKFRRHLEAAIGWLGEFHQALSAIRDDPPPLRLAALESIERYRRHYDCSPEAESLLAETAARLEDYDGPVAPRHGDFCAANVMVSEDDGVCVVDWEYPLALSWPVADLLYFLSSTWCVPYAKGLPALAANYRALFFSEHGYSDLLRRTVSAYLRHLGLAADRLLPLATISWVDYAVRKHEELVELRADGGDESESGYMPLIMVEDRRCLNVEILAASRERFTLG